ncbi:sulfotransferase family 2 domain-containing protein [Salinimicrobium gaetbulicola]|uniref:Sulfotransferase family 2 domain-containing protein n=1 Tax=Salinimicrobium gaetbulicola TaxID=999702 RepID=A0ABW3IJL4_9FLAO
MNKHLLFLHLPKNGGTTLNSILDRLYKKQKVFSIREKNPHELNTADFLKLPKLEKERIRLVKGHLKFGFHEHFTGPSEYFTFLRKPEERIISFYQYVLDNPSHRLFEEVSKMSLYEFVTQLKDADTNNGQVRWISGMVEEGEGMLEKALENIQNHFSFVGFTEEFDESLILLQEKYGWSLPYYKVQNRTRKRQSLEALDDKTKMAIADHNHLDQQLYTIFKERFDQQKKMIRNLNLKVLRLRSYNKLYSIYKG